MPPESDGIRTIGCSVSKLIPNEEHLVKIQGAVAATHKATILATELLNIHLRRCLEEDPYQDFSCFFDRTWLLNAYNEVTYGSRKVKVVEALRYSRDTYMPYFDAPERTGIQQCLLYDAGNLATVAATNVWYHFQPRMLAHVRRIFTIDEAQYNTLSKDAKRQRKLELMKVTSDMCRLPTQTLESSSEYHSWIIEERQRLRIDVAIGDLKGDSFLYHLKARPHRFLYALSIISGERQAEGKNAFALYPLRRHYVPRHIRFDQKALRDLLGFGASDYIKDLAKQRQKMKRTQQNNGKNLSKDEEWDLPPLVAQSADTGVSPKECDTSQPYDEKQKPKRRTKEEMKEENEELFQQILDLRAAKVQHRYSFDYAFTTDGVYARVQMKKNSKNSHSGIVKRGIWAIDALKHQFRLEDLHPIGIDPGKRELIVGVDMDDPINSSTVRYTMAQRLRDLRSRQYCDENTRDKTQEVKEAETGMTGFNSRAIDLGTFCEYCNKRHESLELLLECYSKLQYRRRRWKTIIKTQQSEERLYKQLEALQNDSRPLVLAYGSWGMVAGKPGAACNRGNPPCIGVGLMRKLSKRFLVSPTPEAYTSKTCSRCFGDCGPCFETEDIMGKKIRGLRRCTQRDCMLFLNRDKNGATNIGTNFKRLFEDQGPIKTMTEEDLEFHRASLCLECAD
jgi:hypothetical protein